MKWGRSTIHPNLYVILVGPSGRAKKGTALEFAKPILKGVGVKVIEGAITREKLIRRMSDAISQFSDGSTGLIKFQCAVTCLSDELSVFLGQNNIKFLADLCNWYDCPNEWVYDTKGQGTDFLEGLCFNLIGATAPDWIPSILPKEATGGGFTSRVIWVVEEDKGKTVPEPTFDVELEQLLIRDLEQIFLMSGEFQFNKEAREFYIDWYQYQDAKTAAGHPPIYDPRLAGYCERRATLVKKISMILSASESNDLIVTKANIERSLDLMERVEQRMARAFAGIGAARYAYAMEQMMNFIIRQKVVTRSQVLKFFYLDIDNETFEVCIKTLVNMRVIECQRMENGDIALKLLEDKKELLQ